MAMVDPFGRRIRNIGLQFIVLALSSCAQVESPHSDNNHSEHVEVVDLVMREWYILPDKMTVDEGNVTFTIHNVGRMDHEFIIIKTNLPVHDLPVNEKGLNEKKAGKLIGEIEDIPPGVTSEFTLHMEPGRYVLFCNRVEIEDHKIISHYRMGMRVGFTVR